MTAIRLDSREFRDRYLTKLLGEVVYKSSGMESSIDIKTATPIISSILKDMGVGYEKMQNDYENTSPMLERKAINGALLEVADSATDHFFAKNNGVINIPEGHEHNAYLYAMEETDKEFDEAKVHETMTNMMLLKDNSDIEQAARFILERLKNIQSEKKEELEEKEDIFGAEELGDDSSEEDKNNEEGNIFEDGSSDDSNEESEGESNDSGEASESENIFTSDDSSENKEESGEENIFVSGESVNDPFSIESFNNPFAIESINTYSNTIAYPSAPGVKPTIISKTPPVAHTRMSIPIDMVKKLGISIKEKWDKIKSNTKSASGDISSECMVGLASIDSFMEDVNNIENTDSPVEGYPRLVSLIKSPDGAPISQNTAEMGAKAVNQLLQELYQEHDLACVLKLNAKSTKDGIYLSSVKFGLDKSSDEKAGMERVNEYITSFNMLQYGIESVGVEVSDEIKDVSLNHRLVGTIVSTLSNPDMIKTISQNVIEDENVYKYASSGFIGFEGVESGDVGSIEVDDGFIKVITGKYQNDKADTSDIRKHEYISRYSQGLCRMFSHYINDINLNASVESVVEETDYGYKSTAVFRVDNGYIPTTQDIALLCMPERPMAFGTEEVNPFKKQADVISVLDGTYSGNYNMFDELQESYRSLRKSGLSKISAENIVMSTYLGTDNALEDRYDSMLGQISLESANTNVSIDDEVKHSIENRVSNFFKTGKVFKNANNTNISLESSDINEVIHNILSKEVSNGFTNFIKNTAIKHRIAPDRIEDAISLEGRDVRYEPSRGLVITLGSITNDRLRINNREFNKLAVETVAGLMNEFVDEGNVNIIGETCRLSGGMIEINAVIPYANPFANACNGLEACQSEVNRICSARFNNEDIDLFHSRTLDNELIAPFSGVTSNDIFNYVKTHSRAVYGNEMIEAGNRYGIESVEYESHANQYKKMNSVLARSVIGSFLLCGTLGITTNPTSIWNPEVNI